MWVVAVAVPLVVILAGVAWAFMFLLQKQEGWVDRDRVF